MSALHTRGAGRPFQLQHGLCGDHAQTFEAAPDLPGWELRTLDCPGHGGQPLDGAPSIARFADAVAAETPPGAVLGGISMGAAIALRLAVTRPDLAPRALVLIRPAWGTEPAPPTLDPFALAGRMIADGRSAADYAATPTGRMLASEAPDNLASALGFFAREPLAGTARLLTAIPADGPGVTLAAVAALRLPTLVAACAEDHVHPLPLARDLAAAIPGARFVELPPKGRDKPAHLAALRAALAGFLKGL